MHRQWLSESDWFFRPDVARRPDWSRYGEAQVRAVVDGHPAVENVVENAIAG